MEMIFAIDPGTQMGGLGWAVVQKKVGAIKPVDTGNLGFSSSLIWHERVCLLIQAVFRIWRQHEPMPFIIEIPEHWSGSTGFAARETGAITKLMFLVGSLYGVVVHNNLAPVKLITPREWKGQLPKEVAHRRLRKKLPHPLVLEEKNHNVLDAICIGYVGLGGQI